MDSSEALPTEHFNKAESLAGLSTSRLDQASNSLGTGGRPTKKYLDYCYSRIQTASEGWWIGEVVQSRDY